jgi:hypothetical protein
MASGYGVGQAVAPETVEAQASNRAVLRELQRVNRNLTTLNNRIGSSAFDSNSLRGEVRESLGRPVIGNDITRLLEKVCENSAPSASAAISC